MQLRQRGHNFILPNIKYESNVISIILLLVRYFLMRLTDCVLCACMCVLSFNFMIYSIAIVSTILPLCVNMCACHVFFFIINLLTYLLTHEAQVISYIYRADSGPIGRYINYSHQQKTLQYVASFSILAGVQGEKKSLVPPHMALRPVML